MFSISIKTAFISQTASGKDLPVITIRDLLTRTYRKVSRNDYSGVKAYFWDEAKGDRKEVLVGKEGKVWEMKYNSESLEMAKSKAGQKLRDLKNGSETLNFSVPFDPKLLAERKCFIQNVNPLFDGEWLIKKAHHILLGGSKSNVECIKNL